MVLYEGMEEKSLKALGEIEFLKKYTGILMYDHETAMYHFGTGHGGCNVHLLRYLKKNTEETGNSWSGKMSGLLRCFVHFICRDGKYMRWQTVERERGERQKC